MPKRESLQFPSASHLPKVIEGFLSYGWHIVKAPSTLRMPRNGILVILRTSDSEMRYRVFCYKVSSSSRGRPQERRVEITNTYQTNLSMPNGFSDVVLGFDSNTDTYVGLDPYRLRIGGPTGNASSFVYLEDLRAAQHGSILVNAHPANKFPNRTEFIATIKADRLADYILNHKLIHVNRFSQTSTTYSRSRKKSSLTIPKGTPKAGKWLVMEAIVVPKPREISLGSIIKSIEKHGSLTGIRKSISPRDFEEIQRRMRENGELGEAYVFQWEQSRLRRIGRSDLAYKVVWISKRKINAGYDIQSFQPDGSDLFIEVKASEFDLPTFLISGNEWKLAEKKRASYSVYKVSKVRSKNRKLQRLNDPVALLENRLIYREGSGWRIKVMSESEEVSV